jgi:hypothetical protein
MVNTYRWDYPQVAALVAPRPLLISNSDKDSIFPLDGVVRVHEKVRRIYRLYDKEENLGLNITEGPHEDTQVLQVHAFHWFNRHLKGEEPPIEMAAAKVFEPEQLKVFPVGELPADEINTTIQETFVPMAEPKVPENEKEWTEMEIAWKQALRQKVFRGWPKEPEPLNVEKISSATSEGVDLSVYDFTSQGPWRLRLYAFRSTDAPAPTSALLQVADEELRRGFLKALEGLFPDELADEQDLMADEESVSRFLATFPESQRKVKQITFIFAPRGIGMTAWGGDDRKKVHIERRFQLLGQTLDGMRVWDIVRAAAAIRQIESVASLPLTLKADRDMAGLGLYASLFAPQASRVVLTNLQGTHRDGPVLLNVQRYLDIPQTIALLPIVLNLPPAERKLTQYADYVVQRLFND